MFAKFYHLDLERIDDSFDKIRKLLDLNLLKRMAVDGLNEMFNQLKVIKKDFDLFE